MSAVIGFVESLPLAGPEALQVFQWLESGALRQIWPHPIAAGEVAT